MPNPGDSSTAEAASAAHRLVSWTALERADLRGAFLHEAAVSVVAVIERGVNRRPRGG